ncbi:general transcription factor II-I repeat domain-containing protein 2-like [Diabrotica undecimpunctata]|uniref:general transcription factor II-I repeat domain-containing protein 2-like n=1 Tax=Diabrotica undecimpunctata TaxID=50387 RepID=UPI003B6333E3
MCPEASKKFEKIQLNRMTIQRRIISLSALDESTDISSTAQLLIFIRGVTQDFEVLEELLGMCSLKGQTKGVDILNVLLDECSKTDLDLSKLSGVATDGAPSMIGVNSGLVTLLKKHMQEKNINAEDIMQFHCIIHQEALCSKKIEFQNVVKVVVSIVNFIKSRGNTDNSNNSLMTSKANTEIYCIIQKSQLNSGNYNHFPNYKKMAEKFNKTAINFSYVEKLDILIQSFQEIFLEFKKVKPLLDIFSNPFTISVENVPESMQLEIIDIQNDQDLRNKFNEGDLLNFYRCIDKNI